MTDHQFNTLMVTLLVIGFVICVAGIGSISENKGVKVGAWLALAANGVFFALREIVYIFFK